VENKFLAREIFTRFAFGPGLADLILTPVRLYHTYWCYLLCGLSHMPTLCQPLLAHHFGMVLAPLWGTRLALSDLCAFCTPAEKAEHSALQNCHF
jgi:hypothetical protein